MTDQEKSILKKLRFENISKPYEQMTYSERELGFSITNPFYNCQIAGVAGIENLLYKDVFSDRYRYSNEFILEYFNEIANKAVMKNLYLIDVHRSFKDRILEVFGDRIWNTFEYESTNKSHRVLIMIKSTQYNPDDFTEGSVDEDYEGEDEYYDEYDDYDAEY